MRAQIKEKQEIAKSTLLVRSMLAYIAEEGFPHRVTLVYSNRDQESAAFLDELYALERDNPNLRLVLTMTDDPAWEGETRRVDVDLLRDHLDGELCSIPVSAAVLTLGNSRI